MTDIKGMTFKEHQTDGNGCRMTNQMTLFDIGMSDQYDCRKCVWQQDHGECYPDETLHRRYFYNKTDGRYCSDYCSGYAKVKMKGGAE